MDRRNLLRRTAALAAVMLPPAAGALALPGPLQRPAVAVRRIEGAAVMGLARAGRRIVAVGQHGSIALSDDDGRRWRQATTVPVSVSLTAVQFVDERTGWAVGHAGVVLHSDDAGEHWSLQLDGLRAAQLRVDEARGAGTAGALTEAERFVQEGADKPLLALHFHNRSQGVVSGAFGLLLATVDGGRRWQSVSGRLDNPKGAHLYALHRQDEQVLLAGEQGVLFHSTDAGARFRRVDTGYVGSWFCVTREADGAWLLAGLRGNLRRSRDDGQSWQPLQGQAPVSITATHAAVGGVWLVNQGGQLMHVPAGAPRVELAAEGSAQQPAAVLPLPDGDWLLAGWNGLSRLKRTAR